MQVWSLGWEDLLEKGWQTEGEKVKVVTDFLLWSSKITADGDCNHEIRRWLHLGRKAMTNPDSVLKSKDVTLSTKVHIVKAMVFPVVMYRCKSWTIKKPESPKIDAFELWCWRRFLRVPWTISNNWLIGKDSDTGKYWREKDKRVTENEMSGWYHRFDGHELGKTLGDGKGQGGLECCSPWGCKKSDTTWWQKNDNNKMTLPPCYVFHFVGNLTWGLWPWQWGTGPQNQLGSPNH